MHHYWRNKGRTEFSLHTGTHSPDECLSILEEIRELGPQMPPETHLKLSRGGAVQQMGRGSQTYFRTDEEALRRKALHQVAKAQKNRASIPRGHTFTTPVTPKRETNLDITHGTPGDGVRSLEEPVAFPAGEGVGIHGEYCLIPFRKMTGHCIPFLAFRKEA